MSANISSPQPDGAIKPRSGTAARLPSAGGPTVAILLCTFNGERFLAQQLASLERQTFKTYNYYSEADDTLSFAFTGAEWDNALGETGIEDSDKKPVNYTDRDVTGHLEPSALGLRDDHSTYWTHLGPDGRPVREFRSDVVRINVIQDVFNDIAQLLEQQ